MFSSFRSSRSFLFFVYLVLGVVGSGLLMASPLHAETQGTPIGQFGSSLKQIFAKPAPKQVSSLEGLQAPSAPAAPKPSANEAPVRSTQIELPQADFESIPELQTSYDNPLLPKLKLVDNPNNKLGLKYAMNQLLAVETLMEKKQWVEANAKMTQLRPWLVDATELHIELFQLLGRVPSGRIQAQFEKRLALEFAKLRDLAFMDSATIKIKLGKEREALGDLLAVIKSQSRTEMGQEAYKLMQGLGFTEELQLSPDNK